MRLAVIALFLTGCTQFPQLDARVDDTALTAPFPPLVPLAGVITNAQAQTTSPQAAGPAASRIAALQARADRLRGPIIAADVRARMARGVDERGL